MIIEIINEDTEKFNTCKFRSETQLPRLIKRCSCQGGDYQISGYVCFKKQIFQLTEDICQSCQEYEAK